MTREEAINTLGNFKRYISGGGVTDRKANKAIDMAIESLTYQNLSKPNNTCEVNLISRKDAMGAGRRCIRSEGNAYTY